jgi:hypothetical protein
MKSISLVPEPPEAPMSTPITPGPSADDGPTAIHPKANPGLSRPSRRKVLGALGIGAAAVATPGVATALDRRRRSADGGNQAGRRGGGRADNAGQRGGGRGLAEPNPDEVAPDRFTRIFDDLNPFADNSEELREALIEIGRPGGIMDANDPLEVGPIRLITEPELSPDNRDNPNATAGTTFLGQFVDHDLAMDAASQLGRPTSIRRSSNLRTARFDLDSVYGGGPAESPELYETADQLRFRIEFGGRFEDLPRDNSGSAIIADPRNDENMMISGIQCAILGFHNAVLDRVLAQGLDGDLAFSETQRLVRWHYQWIVVNQYLPEIVGQQLIDDILANGRHWFTTNRPRIPVEFQTSAYRFGHSMIRPSYRANMAGEGGEPFFAFVFDPATFGQSDPDDLTGGSRALRRYIGWQTFFDFDDGEVKPNKRIDTKMSTPLFQLPAFAIGAARGEYVGPTSLATRNLLRHITWGIPSGQDIARATGTEQLSRSDLCMLAPFGARLDQSTPLFFYVLAEAEQMNDGLTLGPVGGRIVAETFLGLLQMDPTSYLAAEPNWWPTLRGRETDNFTMADLLTIAGVDPVSRGE